MFSIQGVAVATRGLFRTVHSSGISRLGRQTMPLVLNVRVKHRCAQHDDAVRPMRQLKQAVQSTIITQVMKQLLKHRKPSKPNRRQVIKHVTNQFEGLGGTSPSAIGRGRGGLVFVVMHTHNTHRHTHTLHALVIPAQVQTDERVRCNHIPRTATHTRVPLVSVTRHLV